MVIPVSSKKMIILWLQSASYTEEMITKVSKRTILECSKKLLQFKERRSAQRHSYKCKINICKWIGSIYDSFLFISILQFLFSCHNLQGLKFWRGKNHVSKKFWFKSLSDIFIDVPLYWKLKFKLCTHRHWLGATKIDLSFSTNFFLNHAKVDSIWLCCGRHPFFPQASDLNWKRLSDLPMKEKFNNFWA